MPASPGRPSSTANPSPRSARSQSRPRTRTFSTPAAASPTSAPRLVPATASTNPPTAVRRGRTSACAIRARSAVSSSIRKILTSFTSALSVTPTVPMRSAASSSQPTAAPPGRTSSTKARTSASPILPSPSPARTSSSPERGMLIVRRGARTLPSTVPAAASIARPTAARPGRNSPATAFLKAIGAASVLPCRLTASASTHCSTWARSRASTAPTMAATPGRSPIATRA